MIYFDKMITFTGIAVVALSIMAVPSAEAQAAEKPFPTPDKPNAQNSKQYPFPANTTPRKLNDPNAHTQLRGALTGRLIYTLGGHGMTFQDKPTGNGWGFDRPNLLNMIEDLGNHDQMTLFADEVFRAGGTVISFRPVGNQTNEVIVDDGNSGFSLYGNWSDNTDPNAVYYGGDEDKVRYRFTEASPTETAIARFRPTIPAPGFYPVYTWVRFGDDLVGDQLYAIRHSGGETRVTIDHRKVGKGWVYLGTYYFEAGKNSYVDISNLSSSQGLVIADAIRFGNGMGDIERGGSVSGRPREDEGARYWVQKSMSNTANHVQRIYDRPGLKDSSSNVGVPPRMASYMNNEKQGEISDRVYISMHTNAKGNISPYDRGADGLWNNDSLTTVADGTKTPHQEKLAHLLGYAVNKDLIGLSNQLEFPWINHRERHELFREDFAFGEIRWDAFNHEMDATILEVAYHDHKQDTALMLNPTVRGWVARSMVKGTVNYFAELGRGRKAYLPEAPVAAAVVNAGGGKARVSWQAAVPSESAGGVPSGFLIYRSNNGYGFGEPIKVEAGQNVVDVSVENNKVTYFRVSAYNEGGESLPSETVAVRPGETADKILIVNGFDRLDRGNNPIEFHDDKSFQRVKQWKTNNRDCVVQHAKALHAAGKSFDSTANDFLVPQALDSYQTLVWILGNESVADKTFDEKEQTLVADFVAKGKNLFVSGSDMGFELDDQNQGKNFFRNTLGATFESNSAGTFHFKSAQENLFQGVTAGKFGEAAPYDNTVYPPLGYSPYRVDSADVLKPANPTTDKIIFAYTEGPADGRGAAVARDNGHYKTVVLGFPFESIASDMDRANIMIRAMEFFAKK